MKSLFFAALLLSGSAVSAQQRVFLADTTGERLRRLNDLIQQRSLLPQATFSHNTSKGKIYILPIDNMPCLVPDMKQVAPMPGQRMPLPESRMPNIMPKQRIIPDQKVNKDK